jgi:hypothetical protein
LSERSPAVVSAAARADGGRLCNFIACIWSIS